MSANLNDEKAVFKEILQPKFDKRFLTVTGQTLFGKSILLKEFEQLCKEEGLPYAKANFKRRHDPHGILDHLCDQLGQGNFKNFYSLSRSIIAKEPKVNIEGGKFIFSSTRIVQTGQRDNTAIYRQLVLDFFNDLSIITRKQSVVLLFDHYEAALQITKDWMLSDFLPKMSRTPNIIVAIAGQEVPRSEDEWEHLYQLITLREISIEHWLQYTKEIGISVSRDSIAMLYERTNGIPGLIASALADLGSK